MNKKIKILTIITCILILIEQAIKILIKQIGNIGNGFIRIENVNNPGIAFGINPENTSNIMLVIVVIGIIINFICQQKDKIDLKTSISLSLIIAGGISNLIDRIFRGAVFDFIRIGNFPIFNLADCFIVIGWILLVIFLIIFTVKDLMNETTKIKGGK